MDVSIVIPTKNGGNQLDNVLSMIEKQKTKYEYEVICVDSGSKDNSIDIIKKHNCKLFVINPEDFGHGKTRNYGASKGSGEYIMFITQDALPYNCNWIESFIDAMKSDEDVVCGFGKHYPYDDCNIFDKRDLEGHFHNFGEINTIYYMDDKERYSKDEGYRQVLAFFSDNNSCLKRSIWAEYNYPDVNFAEDQIWCKKMIELGYKKIYCPDAAVYHSHNYKLSTYFKRYYDEYKGLETIHPGYRIATNWFELVGKCFYHIRSEWKYLNTLKLSSKEKRLWRKYSFWRNHARYYGGYLGGKYHLVSNEKQQKMDKKYSQQYEQRNA